MTETEIIQLHEENLIPLYLIEDKLKQNFRTTNSFILSTKTNFTNLNAQMLKLHTQQKTMKDNFQIKMTEMEKKIVQQISLQLQGRIAIAIGKSIQSFTEKMDKKEKEMGDFKDEFAKKLEKMKQDLKYEVAQESQKMLGKETKRMEENIKKIQKKIANPPPVLQASDASLQAAKPLSSNLDGVPSSVDKKQERNVGQGQNWQEQHEFMKELESRIQKIEDFNINVDKRVYNGMTSLKQSWKQLGTELLENKKSLNKKMDEIRVQFIKLKNLKEFQFAPDKVEEEFQRKLAQKFTDIYQLLSLALTKNQYQSTYERMNSRIIRHDDQFIQIRKQLATNNEFFTFYINNANQEDLKSLIDTINENIRNEKHYNQEMVKDLQKEDRRNDHEIKKVDTKLSIMNKELEQKIKTIDRVNEVVSLVEGRIENLEDFNKFGPDKLETIHNALDGDFTAAERELISIKEKNNVMKDLKIEVGKMKDEMFIISSQNQIKDEELVQLKKMYHQLESKMEKIKGESEEAMIVRKPWVCLSCDKQEKQKQHQKKQAKQKKDVFKGFGTQRSSEKTLRAPPAQPYQERFEVYEKFREKYLSDAVKLPDIVKEKLHNREGSFHT